MNITIFDEINLQALDLSAKEQSDIMAAIHFIIDFRKDPITNYNLPFEALVSEVYKYLALNRKPELGDIIDLGDHVLDGLKKMQELEIIKNGDLIVSKTNVES